MTKRLPVVNKRQELEYELSKIKFMQSLFPDVQYSYETTPPLYKKNLKFYSKLINADFEKLDFQSRYNTLYALPYSEVTFEYNGVSETLKILPIPSQIVLAKKKHIRVPLPGKPYNYEEIVKFARFSFNNKKNAFNQDKLYQDCMVAIVEFVKKYRDVKTDIKHLDPRLKKLLAFS